MVVQVIAGAKSSAKIIAGANGAPGRPGSTVCEIPIWGGGLLGPGEKLGGIFISTPIRVAPERCRAHADGVPADPAVVTFTLDGEDAFSIEWEAGQATGSLAGLPEVIQPGLLRCFAPLGQDPTFSDVIILISGNR